MSTFDNYTNTIDLENDGFLHKDISEEIAFFHSVYAGDMDAIHKNIAERRFRDNEGVGRLSVDPILNLKYHFVVTAAIITRGCIEKGLEAERAFRMSDFYIRKLDYVRNADEIEKIHDDMVLDFTGKMRLVKRDRHLSRTISKCIDYIYAHVSERITIKDLSEHTGVSASYLSRQFAKEIGMPLADYIRERKIEIAQDMLLNSEKSIMEIAFELSFSSQSHFIQVFKTAMGVTPKKYRTLNESRTWS